MRNPGRIQPLLQKLQVAWQTSPDLRLGQLIFVLAQQDDAFYLEDDEFEKRIETVIYGGFQALVGS